MSLLTIALMAVGGISWSMKLDSRIDKYKDLQNSMREQFMADLATTQATLARGILPVTEVKMQSLEIRISALEENVNECLRKNRHSNDAPNRTSPRVSTVPPAMGDNAGISSTTWDK